MSTSGENLVFTIHVANLGGVDPSTGRYYSQQLSWGSTYATASTQTKTPGSATLDLGETAVSGTSTFDTAVSGTSTFDTAASNVVMSFSLAAINAGGPDSFGIGTQSFLHNTVTSAQTLVAGEAIDTINPSPTSYIVGQ